MRLYIIFLILFFVILSLKAGGSGENVALVVNEDSWASLTIANKFINLRKIPPSNVIYLKQIPSFTLITFDNFKKDILFKTLTILEQRGLACQIDYLVYSSDFPYCIDINEVVDIKRARRDLNPYASITGLTYLYQYVLRNNKRYQRLKCNNYMSRRFLGAKDTPWLDIEKALYQQALIHLRQKNWKHARKILQKLLPKHHQSPSLLYNLACCLAQMGKKEKALKFLDQAVKSGWFNHIHTIQDSDLKNLQESNKFQKLLKQMEKNKPFYNFQTNGFRNAYNWGVGGSKLKTGEGVRYLLSTMLGYSSGRGNSLKEILKLLRRSAEADSSFPNGTIYYVVNNNIRSKARHSGYDSAIEVLKGMGVKAKKINGIIPRNKKDVMGAMIGTPEFSWKDSGSIILPGAICEHFTSCGGMLSETAIQTPLSEFIRYGASGSSGTVTEPYAIKQKFPNPFLHVHYTRGCSLAESFYQSIHTPLQLLIVGDPLCQPWAKTPSISISGVKKDQRVKGTITLYPRSESRIPIHHFELFVSGRRHDVCLPGGSLIFDTSKFLDGRTNIRIVGVLTNAVQTKGSLIIPVNISNKRYNLEVSITDRKVKWDEILTIDASMKNARKILFLHNLRVLAEIDGSKATLQFSPKKLGLGKINIKVIALKNKKHGVVKNLPVEIVPPAYLPSLKKDNYTNRGLTITTRGISREEVLLPLSKNWLKKYKISHNQTFVLEGYFDVSSTDLYQFQLNYKGNLELSIDQKELLNTKENSGWNYVLAPLQKGRHHLFLIAKLQSNKLEIKFGNKGVYSIGSKNF